MKRTLKHRLVPSYLRFATSVSRDEITREPGRPNAYLLLTPDYGNIGDLAIGYAEAKFLRQHFPMFSVQTVPLSQTYRKLRSIRRNRQQGDVAFLVGGGSMGDLYPRAQLGRQFIAGYLKDMPIISFPQSLIYTSEAARKSSGYREATALGAHPELTLCAREETSFRMMREMFTNHVIYAPDIVLSLIESLREKPQIQRENHALLALRNDAEKRRTATDEVSIRDAVSVRGLRIVERDNSMSQEDVDSQSVEHTVSEMLSTYQKCQFVITDRLHGMIFATITGTPCVVLPNTNHKISQSYQAWIRGQCPYVEFIEDPSSGLQDALDRVTSDVARQAYETVSFDYGSFVAEIRRWLPHDTAAA